MTRMKTIVGALVLAAVAVGIASERSAENGTALKARARPISLEFDFGDVLLSQAQEPFLSHTFDYRHEGELSVHPRVESISCGCLGVEMHDSVVLPGSDLRMGLRLDTRKASGVSHVSAIVELPETGQHIVLSLRARLRRPLEADPSHVEFALPQATASFTLTCLARDKPSIQSKPDWLDAQIHTIGDQGARHAYRVDLVLIGALVPSERVISGMILFSVRGELQTERVEVEATVTRRLASTVTPALAVIRKGERVRFLLRAAKGVEETSPAVVVTDHIPSDVHMDGKARALGSGLVEFDVVCTADLSSPTTLHFNAWGDDLGVTLVPPMGRR